LQRLVVIPVAEDGRLTIAVPTYRRTAELAALLPLLDAARSEVPGMTVELLVVDNDPGASAALVVASPGFEHVRYVHEDLPGIAAVRQRILDETRSSDAVVLLDDDLVPRRQWLASLVAEWERSAAAVVVGHVEYVFDPSVDPLVVEGRFFYRPRLETGRRLSTMAAGNILVDRARLDPLGVSFDRRLGLSGGEDTLFGRQVVAAGGHIVFCGESEVVGTLPLERTGREQALTRARGHGGVEVRVALFLARGPAGRAAARMRAAAGGAARVLLGTLLRTWGAAAGNEASQARGLRVGARGQGMLLASFGRFIAEYRRPPIAAPRGGSAQ
jgi:succinoglycan biosynthesis protein ExoM